MRRLVLVALALGILAAARPGYAQYSSKRLKAALIADQASPIPSTPAAPAAAAPAPAAPVPAPAAVPDPYSALPPAAPGEAGCGGCELPSCDMGCDLGCPCPIECWQFFGDFLLMRPRNARVAYAVPANGPIVPDAVPVQVGRTAIVDPEFEPAFRVGFARALTPCSTLGATYTYYYSRTNDSLEIADQQLTPVIVSNVLHPGIDAADNFWEFANAREDLRFQLVDLDYRHVLWGGGNYTLSGLVGLRYANLNQSFESNFLRTGTIRTADAEVNFDGGGIRVGLDGERVNPCSGLLLYGRAAASFVGGDFRGHYNSASNVQAPLVVDTTWNSSSLVSILDLEIGAGWTNATGRIRGTVGYAFSGWYNTMTLANYIRSVQDNNDQPLIGVDHNFLGFDGLVTRAEIRW